MAEMFIGGRPAVFPMLGRLPVVAVAPPVDMSLVIVALAGSRRQRLVKRQLLAVGSVHQVRVELPAADPALDARRATPAC